MIQNVLIGISLLTNLFPVQQQEPSVNVLSERNFNLEERYPDKWVSNVFKDNILLTLYYLRGNEKTQNVDWAEVQKPFHYEFKLKKDKVFAFHEDVLPQFEGKVVKTTNSHFNSYEGFKSDGWLIGDGVCHLASFINMAARDAGLNVLSPVNHNFAAIPQVPWEYGVSIFSSQKQQNLYVTNNKEAEIALAFDYKDAILKVSVLALNKANVLDDIASDPSQALKLKFFQAEIAAK